MDKGQKVTIVNPNIDISSDEESDDSREDEFVPFSKRPEWADLKPVPQDDGPYSVVAIRYSDVFRETFDYFRAILAAQEISERALKLTLECIKLNPSNYTLWHYRRVLLEKLNKPLLEELEFIEEVISRNQKNYQVWEHYKYILCQIKARIDEKKLPDVDPKTITVNVKRFIRLILAEDSKNYHAWQQLQWLIKGWSQWTGELEYVQKLVDDDIRNNSAWNHRFYVIQNTTGFTDDVIQSECDYTLKLIRLAPNNESAWNYLLGVLRKSSKSIDSFPEVLKTCENLNHDPESRSSYLLGFMVTYLSEKLEKYDHSPDGGDEPGAEQFRQAYKQAIDYCTQLATKIDTLREQYWKYQASELASKYQSLAA